MSVLFLTKNGDGIGLASKWKAQGHSVSMYGAEDSRVYSAGVPKDDRVSVRLKQYEYDFVIADMVGAAPNITRRVQQLAYPSISVNDAGYELEKDREKQYNVFVQRGVNTPVTYIKQGTASAYELRNAFPEHGFVIKPSGNQETSKTRVCRDEATFVWALEQHETNELLVIQEVVKGIEVSTEGWFSDGWSEKGWTHTFEEKRLFNNQLGPNTGCMGNVVVPIIRPDQNKLVAEVKKLTSVLTDIGYVGPVDLNAIVNKKGIHALELTMRLGYDAIECLHALWGDDLYEYMRWLAMADADTADAAVEVSSGYATAVRVVVPPYPYSGEEKHSGMPVSGIENSDGFYLTDLTPCDSVGMIEAPYKTIGIDGVVCKAVGVGNTIQASIDKAYAKAARVKALDVGYRTDIGKRVSSDLVKLAEYGMF